MSTKLIMLIVAFMATLLVGCEAFSPQPLALQDMIPKSSELIFKSSGKSCALGEFEGLKGKEDLIFKVTVFDLKKVVEDGLKNSQLFTSVYQSEQHGADYTLLAKILGQPVDAGISITVTLVVDYKIKRNDTDEVIFNKRIAIPYTATPGEAMVGMTRIRKANEGAVRENVKELLKEISKIPL